MAKAARRIAGSSDFMKELQRCKPDWRIRHCMKAAGKSRRTASAGDPSGQSLELADAHRSGTAIAEAELVGGGFAEIDDPAAVERAAIVDGHLDLAAGALVGDHELGAEGEGAMRRGHGVFVEDFSRGGLLPVEAGTVPGGAAALGIGCSGE